MRVTEWDDFIHGADGGEKGLAVTIGVFDGVHRGHQALIQRILAQDLHSVVITFKQNPKKVLNAHNFAGDIYSLEEKLAIFEQMGVEETALIDFSGNFSKLSGREFVNLLKTRRAIRFLAVGSNFRCGYRLDTDAAALRNMAGKEDIRTELVCPVMEGRHSVSSSRIRAAIRAGDLKGAELLLGRPYRKRAGLSPQYE
jgi:riboflavin kinase/FMN adenylyltransferase